MAPLPALCVALPERLLFTLEPELTVPDEPLLDEPDDLFIDCPVLESRTLPELSTILVRDDVPELLTPEELALPEDVFLIELFADERVDDELRPEDETLLELPIDETLPVEFAELVLYVPELLPERLELNAE